jgi:hypothetical protein
MFGKKCPSCNIRIKKKFNFCPSCGYSLKNKRRNEDMGLLGLTDEMKLPFPFNAMMKPLVKQLEKELASLDMSEMNQPPKGFKIQISTGKPTIHNMQTARVEEPTLEDEIPEVSEKEATRRQKLKKVEAKSIIRRLPEGIVYEISTPGVKSKKEVVVAQLEDNIEVRAYAKDVCHVKTIPIKAEILGYKVSDEKVLLKLKG